MRRINKDLTDIPDSLEVNDHNLTHRRRKELIEKRVYIDEKVYNDRYKTDDIKNKLNSLYHQKCAYCEDHAARLHVEHYRPKNIYYWLAYSWDNLLYSCPDCNNYKGTHFDIVGKKVTSPNNTDDLTDINIWSSQKYDQQEKPLLLNPERDELDNAFSFDKDGKIFGKTERASYTIKICHLDRKTLNDERRAIIDKFIRDIRAEVVFSHNQEDRIKSVEVLIRNFKRHSEDEANTFTAYRKAAILWISDIIKEICSNY